MLSGIYHEGYGFTYKLRNKFQITGVGSNKPTTRPDITLLSGVEDMKNIFNSLILVATAMSMCFGATPDLTRPLILDDFDDLYGDSPNRNCLGAIRSNFESGNGYSGDYGYWYIYCSHGYIARGSSSDTLQSDSMKYMCEEKVLHVKMKLEPQSGSIYPGVEIGTSFFKDGVDTVDLSKMTAIVFKAKGSGTIRIGIKSYNVLPDWGFCSDTITLGTAWKTYTIPVAKLKAAPYSDSVSVVTWDKSKKKTFGFQIKTEAQKSAEVYMDSIAFAGMKYSDVYAGVSVNPSFVISPENSANMISVVNGLVSYTINQPQKTSISLFNARGEMIDNIYSGNASVGTHSIALPRSVTPGTYFIRMNNAQGAFSHKFSIVK
jgi:hypothetical protein